MPAVWPWALAALFAIAWTWRALFLGRVAATPLHESLGRDSQVYWTWAGWIVTHGLLGRNAFFMGPLYAYFLAALRGLFHLSISGVLQVQIVLGAASVVALADAARRLTRPWVGFAIGLLMALYGMAVLQDGLVLMESLLFLLECVLLWVVVRTPWETARGGWLVLVGVLIGLIATARATGALLLLPALLALVTARGGARRAAAAADSRDSLRLRHPASASLVETRSATPGSRASLQSRESAAAAARRALLVLGGFLAISAPVAWRNYHVSGEWIPFTYNFGYNLYVGNNPDANGGFVLITGPQAHEIVGRTGDGAAEADGREFLRKTRGLDLTPRASSRYWAGEALAWARDHRRQVAGLAGRKLLMLWNRREYPQVENLDEFQALAGPVGLPFLGTFAFLGPLALAALLYSAPRSRRGAFLIGYVLCVTASVLPFFVTDRYRHHLIPAVALLAALTLDRLLGIRRLTPRRRLGLAAALAAGVVLVFLPAPGLSREKYAWSLASDLGSRWLEQNRPDLAAAELEKALAIERSGAIARGVATATAERADLYYNYAIALTRLGRSGEALAYYERAVAEAPGDAAAVRALAHAYAAAGRAAEAERLYARLPALPGGEAGALAAQGWQAAREGRLEEAEGWFADAVRLDAHQADVWAALARVRIELQRLPEARAALEGARRAGLAAPLLHAHEALLEALAGDAAAAQRELAAVDPAAAARDPVLADVVAQARAVLGRR